ncbi:unnamed protein product (macronuclear) [Paramecium tetraurelia]|uniref:Phosphoenolpyruvate carboxylase n=1 Tax=Paramecium tetraurelia TaxID=5888 RepID=A0BC60_PARTE|nr:uncharacterized protein GSPATT00000563001 [Paramecium tetraurelia]CAK56127.1 unnamed protein product [Paramecium tetraurelia]|eukprot:XP_001423525.1 hypothetical protein (macronuclear) [Paramecium tetraurelia strain d4-2]
MIKSFSFLLQRISRFPQTSINLPRYILSENVKEKQIRENDMLWIAANADDKRCSISEIQKFIKEEPILEQSPIRLMDLGNNYFRHINPRKKKTMLQLLDAYVDNLTESEIKEFQNALSIYFDNSYEGKDLEELNYEEKDLPEQILWHLYSLMIFDRISSQYARYEYLDQFRIIEYFNKRDKEKINRVKYVFTSHPTQPNSLTQLIAISRMLQGIEQNDYKYLKYAAKLFIQSNKQRVFNKVSYIEESLIYHSQYLPNLIKAVAQAYELGLQNPEEFIETPGTWLTFDFDNHPGMEIGIMTYTHGLTMELTLQQYKEYIAEAKFEDHIYFKQILELYQQALEYSRQIRDLSDKFRVKKEISVEEFFQQLPIYNIKKIEDQINQVLEQILLQNDNSKDYFIALKLKKLYKIFRLTGVLGQIRLAGEDLTDINKIKPMIKNIFKEISLLNANGQAADMVIIANFQTQSQYDLVIQNMEIVPLLESFSSTNNTDSRITMIASSDTRQRDGLILTELRNMREFKRNPEKYIYMGQGITPERGGGPYELIHTKYQALTRAQRKLHIRTIQGHYFTSEFVSEDVAFTFMLNGLANINYSDDFEPSYQYMDFLFELDNFVGVPQRAMQKTKEYNDLYLKNQVIKTMVESFNFGGSRETAKPFENLKNQRAIVQAYCNSDRCSFTHPELAYWDRVPEELVNKIATYYYNNHPHMKYLLYMYALMVRRCNLDFAKQEVGLDSSNPCYQAMEKGRAALIAILDQLGLGNHSTPMIAIWKQHLGCQLQSMEAETDQKFKTFMTLNKLQLYQAKKIVKHGILETDGFSNQRKLRLLQSTLANMTSFAGKG